MSESLAQEVQEFYARQAASMTPEERRTMADAVRLIDERERPTPED